MRSTYNGFNDLKLDLHGTVWINAYTGRQFALGGTPEAGTANMTLDTSAGIFVSQNARIGWVSGFNALSVSGDIELSRDAAGILALKNGTSATEYRVYGTTTGSKYASLKHDGTTAILSSSSGGTKLGTAGTAIAHIKRYTVTLVAGTATVSDTDITANTVVHSERTTTGGTPGHISFSVSAGSSFTVSSSSGTETSTFPVTVIIYP